ncbi:hypothetical protein LX32DRAFT_323161 [Colletotrichum zoysiae]|uniref:Uncharacterized protein n=1 Tax=Colletotrichum zoysiae TaxID=1216348 RepID=A0AAD9H367_9PEZI|nr:hypothetical protein LX32DRAFT_323161 [Colletotrichum zoysiae]
MTDGASATPPSFYELRVREAVSDMDHVSLWKRGGGGCDFCVTKPRAVFVPKDGVYSGSLFFTRAYCSEIVSHHTWCSVISRRRSQSPPSGDPRIQLTQNTARKKEREKKKKKKRGDKYKNKVFSLVGLLLCEQIDYLKTPKMLRQRGQKAGRVVANIRYLSLSLCLSVSLSLFYSAGKIKNPSAQFLSFFLC